MDDERYAAGDRLRRQVMGDEFVERSAANADDFTRPFQELATEYCWGVVSRDRILPGHDPQTMTRYPAVAPDLADIAVRIA